MTTPKPLHFYLSTEMWWYRAGEAPHIWIGEECEVGFRERGELSIKWHSLGGKDAPRLEMFDDGWRCLVDPQVRALFEWMASVHDANVTPRAVCEQLERLGFVNDAKATVPAHLVEHDRAHLRRLDEQRSELIARLRSFGVEDV